MQIDLVPAILFVSIGACIGFVVGRFVGWGQGVQDAIDDLRPASPSTGEPT